MRCHVTLLSYHNNPLHSHVQSANNQPRKYPWSKLLDLDIR